MQSTEQTSTEREVPEFGGITEHIRKDHREVVFSFWILLSAGMQLRNRVCE